MARRKAKAAPPPALPELEAEVMEEAWRHDEVTVRDVLVALNQGSKERAYTTIMTIMGRLDRKDLLTRRRVGKTDLYRPTMSRAEYHEARARAQIDELVSDYGDVALAHFARQLDGLDPKRREALRRLAEGEA
jgi:predicted transcriptional regulator